MFQQSKDHYRAVVEDQTELIHRVTADGTFLFVNEVFCHFFGKSREELLGAQWRPAVVPEDIPMIEAKLATLSPANPVVIIENRIYSGRGEVHWFQFVNRGIFDSQGSLLEIQAVGRDISDLKLAVDALHKSEERLSLALVASHMGVWEWDVQTNAIYWSPECFEIFDPGSFTGTLESFTGAIHPDDLAQVMDAARKALAEGTDFNAEFRILRHDGELRWLCDRGRPSYDASGAPLRLAGTVQDITERKRSEAKLAKLHEKTIDLSAHLETVREQERLAISREIHDEIGQTLTALKLDLSWIKLRVAPGNQEIAKRLTEMRAGLDYLIAKAQSLTAELRPPLLDNLGLQAAIAWQLRQFQRRSGLDCRFSASEIVEPGNGAIATAVLRILQEALTNTLRHAQATEVHVSLCCGAGILELEIFDNGAGITAEQISAPTAYGIMGMQERARLCHGELEIIGTPGKGTTVCLTLPLDNLPPGAAEDP
jgi:two-component system, NarL family, sensor histidine kinase UhpB